jgi:hypothetical protein
MQSGQVGGDGAGEAVELLVMKVAGDTKTIVALLRREAGEEQGRADESSGETARRQRDASDERAANRRRLPKDLGVTGR